MSPMISRPPEMELALLGLLSNGPVHGYQLHQEVTDPNGLGLIWQVKQSQLYALLAKLEKAGYIHGEIEPQEPARPPRKIFQLTESGKIAYQKWLKSPVTAHHRLRQDFMAKLFFTLQEGGKPVQELIALQKAACQKWLKSVSAEKVDPASFRYFIKVYRIGQINADLNWLDEISQSF